jgi:small ligand-binding sensory domain FIST
MSQRRAENSAYASALSIHPNSFDAAAECAGDILEQLDGERPDLAVIFASEHHLDTLADLSSGLRKLLEADVVVGSSAVAVAGGRLEIETGPSLSVFAANWGGGRARGMHLEVVPSVDGVRIDGWPDDADTAGTLLLFVEPSTFPVNDFLAICNEHTPDLTVIGGMASGAGPQPRCLLALDDAVYERGAVAVLLDPQVRVRPVVSQGCRPIGQPFTITRAERNVVQELAGQPPLERLRQVVAALEDDDQELIRRGLHMGIVVDEHQLDFGRGDFLVRNLIGADETTGALAIGEIVDAGQTVQFHVRDAVAADEDLVALLADVEGSGALLFTCNGRGRHLFGEPDHDAGLIQDRIGPAALAGMFCSGEIGPIGGRTFVHGFTASVAVFE